MRWEKTKPLNFAQMGGYRLGNDVKIEDFDHFKFTTRSKAIAAVICYQISTFNKLIFTKNWRWRDTKFTQFAQIVGRWAWKCC